MTLFKFLAADGTGPFSGYRWPLPRQPDVPGAWVEADPTSPLEPCRSGVHLCRDADLPYWLNRELYVAEVDGERRALDTVVLARRARLARRVGSWNAPCAQAFTEACAWCVRDRAVEALRGAGLVRAAEELAHAASLLELQRSAQRAEQAGPRTPLPGYLLDAVSLTRRATEHWASTAAAAGLVAATAVGAATTEARSRDAQREERARQAAWLTEALEPARS